MEKDTKSIEPHEFIPIFCSCVILPPKNKRPKKYRVCDRVVSVNDYVACIVEREMPGTIGFFRKPEEAYDYLKEIEGEDYEE